MTDPVAVHDRGRQPLVLSPPQAFLHTCCPIDPVIAPTAAIGRSCAMSYRWAAPAALVVCAHQKHGPWVKQGNSDTFRPVGVAKNRAYGIKNGVCAGSSVG